MRRKGQREELLSEGFSKLSHTLFVKGITGVVKSEKGG